MGLLGAHVSISGGIEKAPLRGDDLHCDAIQIFSKPPMRWKTNPLSEKEIALYRENLRKSAVKMVIIHDSYLINLGSPERGKLRKSRDTFLEVIVRAESLNALGLVLHPGSHVNRITEDDCLKVVAESIDIMLAHTKDFKLKLLLENTAGQGFTVGYKFEHLARIIELVSHKDGVKVCFDTCHAFASGYDMRTDQAYHETFRRFNDSIGLDKIAAFHINDSKKGLGTRVDRHENLGHGFLGKEPFRYLVNDTRFKNVPMILETPGGNKWFKTNLMLLRSMIE